MLFVDGFKVTIIIAVFATLVGIIIGTLVAIGKVYCAQTGRLKPLNWLIDLYLTVFRGTPVVVQLMIWYLSLIHISDVRGGHAGRYLEWRLADERPAQL